MFRKLIRTIWAIVVLALVGVILVSILMGGPLSSSSNGANPDYSGIQRVGDAMHRAADTQAHQSEWQNNYNRSHPGP